MAPMSDEKSDRIELKARKSECRARRAAKKVRPIEPGQVTCSAAQAAAAAGVATSTVWLWLAGNKLASRSVGGRRLISVASLYALIGADACDNQGEG